jgi:outer membrane receptor protein involved in Fe transport
MMKRALAVVLSLLSLSLPLAAQQTIRSGLSDVETISRDELQTTGEIDAVSALSLERPDLFRSVDGALLIHGLPVLTLLDGRRFPIGDSLGRMGMTPLDLFPVAFLSAVEVQKVGGSPRYGSDGPGGVVNLQLNRNYYSGGEAGVFYGKSGGKYGREDFQAYIIGGVGNDKVHFTAGASYEESSGRIPRYGR